MFEIESFSGICKFLQSCLLQGSSLLDILLTTVGMLVMAGGGNQACQVLA